MLLFVVKEVEEKCDNDRGVGDGVKRDLYKGNNE